MRELVSIIIPIFNKEEYLDKCLSSIRQQTYANIEIIMIDDGSIDNSKEICEEYVNKDKRFSYYYQKNSGVSVARNYGLSLSRGKWIMFVDPDDYLDLTIIEKLISKVDDETDIISCCCNAVINNNLVLNEFFESDRIFEQNFDDKSELIMALMNEQYNAKYNRYTAIGVPWAKLYRKSFILKNNLKFDKDLKRMQDNIFNMYAFDKANKIVYINKPLYFYCCDNIMNINKKYDPLCINYFSKIINIRKNYLDRSKLIKSKEIEQEFNKEVYKLITVMVGKYFFNNKNTKNSIERSKELKKFIANNGYIEYLKKIDLNKKINNSDRLKIVLLRKNIFLYSLLFKYKNIKNKNY